MSKELMEIGGFITEGAEIVNHDNSLSGNGTVDSPLGLSNETMLFSGTRTHSLTTNESIFNFEYIDVYQSLAGAMQCPAQRIDTSSISTAFRIGCSYQYDTTMMYYFGSIWTVGSDGKTLSAPNKGNGFSVNLTNGAITTHTNNSSNGCIMKIVGINRKA